MPRVGQKGFAHILLLILLVAGIALGIYLVQNRTNIFPRAASEPVGPFTGFTLFPSKDIVTQGSEFQVKVLANSDFDAANLFTLVMDYPTNLVEVVGVEPSESTPSSTFIKRWIDRSVDNGKVTLSGAVPNPGLKTAAGSSETMAIITFRVHAPSGKIALNVLSDSAIYRNSDNQNIISGNKNASISIGPHPSTSAIPPVDSDSDGFLDGEELFYGTDPNKSCGVNAWPPDLNDDTYINGGDVSALVPYTSGAKPYSKRYDLNRDGAITQDDVTVIQKYFLKSCNVAPVCTTSSAKTSTVNSNSQVTWTYSFADPTKITKASFQATPGVAWKAAGLQGQPGAPLEVGLPGGVNPFVFSAIVSQACQAFTGQFTLVNSCGTSISSFVGIGSSAGWGQVCQSPIPSFLPSPTPTPTPPPVDGKRADLYKDPQKPNFVNDQDISVFYSKCAEKGIELFGQPASVQPICDILEDGKITVQDWAVLIKFRNQSVQ